MESEDDAALLVVEEEALSGSGGSICIVFAVAGGAEPLAILKLKLS